MEQNEKPTGGAPTSVTFLDFFQVVLGRIRTVATISVVTAIGTALYMLFLPNVYSAKAKVLPSQLQPGLFSTVMMQGALGNIGADIIGESKTSKLYAEMLKIDNIRDAVIDRFKLMEVYKKKSRQDMYNELGNVITIQVGKEGIITITVDDKDPQRAADMANAFVEELQKLAVNLNMTGAGGNRAFLEERLAKAKAELAVSENALKSFQSRYKAVNVPQQAEITIKGVAELKGQLTAQEIQLANLRRTMTDSSQEIKNLKTTIANLRSQIARHEEGRGGGAVPFLGAVPQLGQEYLRFMREFKTNESLVEMLTKQYEMARFTEANNVSTIQVLQKARVPDRKSKPQRAVRVVMATVIAFFFSIMYAFILDRIARMPDEERKRYRLFKESLLLRK